MTDVCFRSSPPSAREPRPSFFWSLARPPRVTVALVSFDDVQILALGDLAPKQKTVVEYERRSSEKDVVDITGFA